MENPNKGRKTNVRVCMCCRGCDLTLLRPLWQLFTTMEGGVNQDPTCITVLLPLHRALTELFFIAETKALVRLSPPPHTHTYT